MIQYRNKYFRVLAALAATLYILFDGRPFEPLRALSSPRFYLAFVVSFSVALFIIYLIHGITMDLDREVPWNRGFVIRLANQIALCIFTPVTIDVMVMGLYFWALNEDIFTNGFFTSDLPRVLVMLVLLNVYYALHAACVYLWRKHKSRLKSSL